MNLAATHFQVGFTAATPTCAFMISRCLYLVVKHQAFESSNVSPQGTSLSASQRAHASRNYAELEYASQTFSTSGPTYHHEYPVYVQFSYSDAVNLLIEARKDYLVQNSRFVVYEQYGCMPSVQPSGLYIIIVSYIPMASISVSIYYLGMSEVVRTDQSAD